MLTGVTIPEPIKRNAFKALGQLCTAAIEVPIALLEGIAAEKRAETAGRVKLISKGSDQIASQMDMDPSICPSCCSKIRTENNPPASKSQ